MEPKETTKRKMLDYFGDKNKKAKDELSSNEKNIFGDYFSYKKEFIRESARVYEKLLDETESLLEQKTVKYFGRAFNEPRLTSVHGDTSVLDKTYTYSHSLRTLNPMTPALIEIQDLIEKETGIHFDFVLLNYYRNGNDKVSWHSDDESMMDCDNIVSISLGTERKFQVREKSSREIIWEENLEAGSLLWMKKGSQSKYQHQVPKQTKVESPRLNLTFRKFKTTTSK